MYTTRRTVRLPCIFIRSCRPSFVKFAASVCSRLPTLCACPGAHGHTFTLSPHLNLAFGSITPRLLSRSASRVHFPFVLDHGLFSRRLRK